MKDWQTNNLPIAMVSSTARDLPEHRREVLEACLRLGFHPKMMEHLPAADADAIDASLALVDSADIYIGIFAHRYGYIPAGYDISITEMEYNHAVKRGIPRLIFFMHGDHPIKAADVETGKGAAKLAILKQQIGHERVAAFFRSPEDLRAHVIHALAEHSRHQQLSTVLRLHSVSTIPEPPEPFIAHPYTLLQTDRLIGRNDELRQLTYWLTEPSTTNNARIFCVVAIGGMGKSALTWEWFKNITSQYTSLAGRMWWSFYESDAHFDNFVSRALAYVSARTKDEIEKLPQSERENALLAIFDAQPFLLVLDGFERLLLSYARMDAAHMDDVNLDTVAAQHQLRKAVDPRVGAFLRKLCHVQSTRVLVSTRLFPADLQTVTGEPRPGVFAYFLTGLSGIDAINLWRRLGAKGLSHILLPLFDTFERHPLLIQALAGEVAHYREAPGDFNIWWRNHKDFDPFGLPLVQTKTHVLSFALRGLDKTASAVLQLLAAFRMPTSFNTLMALLVGSRQPCANEEVLDTELTELEDRGLLGWDKPANRYDLHPLIRGVIWNGLEDAIKRRIYRKLHGYFQSVPKVSYDSIHCLEDVTAQVELYNTLVGLRRYEKAYRVFRDGLDQATLYRLGANRERADLLELLFPDGIDHPPRLHRSEDRIFVLNALSGSYSLSGQVRKAEMILRQLASVLEKRAPREKHSMVLSNLGYLLHLCGSLQQAETVLLHALVHAREARNTFWEAISLLQIGPLAAVRGETERARVALKRAIRILVAQQNTQAVGVAYSSLAQRALWLCQATEAQELAGQAWEFAHIHKHERDFIHVAYIQGKVALAVGELARADERLHYALTHARAVNLIEEELPALIALAELHRRQNGPDKTRELLDDVWELVERGPYTLFAADAFNVLAHLERSAGDHTKAVGAATRAFELAWCDGPPFAYHWGLEVARAQIAALHATVPALPAFDQSKFLLIPSVEINPADQFNESG
jgi:tetratricopeptide (TPR) repeat protein